MATIQDLIPRTPSSCNKLLRKVQSMDCVLPSVQIKGEWSYPNSPGGRRSSKKKASRFSRGSTTHRNPTKSPTLQTKSPSHLTPTSHSSCSTNTPLHQQRRQRSSTTLNNHLTRSTSTTSINGLDVVTEDTPGVFLWNEQRSVSYGTVFLLFFFLASVSSYSSAGGDSKGFFYYMTSSSSSLSSSSSSAEEGGKTNVLGSALISSVTEVLNPILPFTGGIDLRRDGNWRSWRNWFGLISPSVDSVSSGANSGSPSISLFPRGGSNTPPTPSNTVATLSTNEPFLSTTIISQMTLHEIAIIFRYVLESNRPNVTPEKFLAQPQDGAPIRPLVQETLHAIDDAAAQSRGPSIHPADTSELQQSLTADDSTLAPLSPTIGYGDVDALQFCAAMRLFAEWRLLRQVPAGYKAYAVGMNLGHKDIVQNVAKIEKAVHEWIQMNSSGGGGGGCVGNSTVCPTTDTIPRSPTLRQLLVHELNANTHLNKLPRLRDNTAAMGLLWVRRQLHYQTVIFRNVISIPEVYPSAVTAVGAAYKEVYDRYHGWAVQKIFNYSFMAAPVVEEIFWHMNPREVDRVRLEAGEIGAVGAAGEGVDDEELDDSNQSSSETNTPSSQNKPQTTNPSSSTTTTKNENPLARLGSHIASEWDKLGHELDKLGQNVVTEWDKLGQHLEGEFEKVSCNVGKILHHKNAKQDCDVQTTLQPSEDSKIKRKPQQLPQTNSLPGGGGLTGEALEKFINERMTMDARRQIMTYLLVAQPLLADLSGLFDEMNMDDPTKV